MLNVPFISLDTLYFTPGWGHISTSEFRAKLKAALEDAPNGWVVDGNYGNRLGNILQSRSTDMICVFAAQKIKLSDRSDGLQGSTRHCSCTSRVYSCARF
jgi:hypothetical protein